MWAMPRTDSRVSGTTSSSPNKPAYPRLMPNTSHPRPKADRTAARMTAFSPGASPPPVEIAMRIDAVPNAGAPGWRLRDTPVTRALDQADDLTVLGVAAELRLFEDRRPVERHLEPPAARRLQRELRVRIPFLELGRQPGGPRLVVSKRAVLDGDLHAPSRIAHRRRATRATRTICARRTPTPAPRTQCFAPPFGFLLMEILPESGISRASTSER